MKRNYCNCGEGFMIRHYCPKCKEVTDCYRDVEAEELDILSKVAKTMFTCGLYLIREMIKENGKHEYHFTCQECGHHFTLDSLYRK